MSDDVWGEILEENRVDKQPEASGNGERQASEATEPTGKEAAEGSPASVQAAAPPDPAKVEAKPTPTPKEILGDGFDSHSWDDVKAKLGEIGTLSQSLEEAKKQPKVSFASDNIAGFNAFVQKTGIENHSVYQTISALKDEDGPIKKLVANFILKHPNYAGKEEMVEKKLSADYKITGADYTADEIEMNMIQAETDADAAMKDIKELRESLKIQKEAEAPQVDMKARTAEWTSTLTSELSGLTKLPIPIKDKDGKVGRLSEIDIPPSVVQSFIETQAGRYAQQGATSAMDKARVQYDYALHVTARMLPDIIAHATLKAETETEARIDAKYRGAENMGKENEKPGEAKPVDAYDALYGPMK